MSARGVLTCLTSLVVVLFCAGVHAQTSATPAEGVIAYENVAMPSDAKSLFDLAQRANELGDPTLKPWHVGATYRTFDAKGGFSHEGTVEIERAAADRHRVSFAGAGYTATFIRTPDGLFSSEATGHLPYAEGLALRALLMPLGTAPVRDGLSINSVDRGQVKLACVGESRPGGVPEQYCFGQDHPMLRVLEHRDYTCVRNEMALFQHRYVSRSVEVRDTGTTVVTVAVQEIRLLRPEEVGALVAPQTYTARFEQGLSGVPGDPLLPPELILGSASWRRTGGEPPTYPVEAKQRRIEGVVRVHAVVGSNGQVRTAEVEHSVDPLLSGAALKYVKGSRYEPVLAGGKPVEWEQNLAIQFRLSQ